MASSCNNCSTATPVTGLPAARCTDATTIGVADTPLLSPNTMYAASVAIDYESVVITKFKWCLILRAVQAYVTGVCGMSHTVCGLKRICTPLLATTYVYTRIYTTYVIYTYIYARTDLPIPSHYASVLLPPRQQSPSPNTHQRVPPAAL
jgi:hypothetical protein